MMMMVGAAKSSSTLLPGVGQRIPLIDRTSNRWPSNELEGLLNFTETVVHREEKN
jgi:hypothetical protein